ncbi:hypothetical protein PIB30_077394 [Stylosanthes scabra]|uniref:Uncharacterized protein n=1 Tax=Stylosanthes scabra TaxID=79078 RepID=A0ABU6ZP42_9FABA|nr:hypothetical protein [Stylosanthes scabra]
MQKIQSKIRYLDSAAVKKTYHLHRHHQSPISSQPPSTTGADHHHRLHLRSNSFNHEVVWTTADLHCEDSFNHREVAWTTVNILKPSSFFVVLQPQSTLQFPSTTDYHSLTKVSQSVNPNQG